MRQLTVLQCPSDILGIFWGPFFSQALVHWNFSVSFSLILGFVVFASLLLFIFKMEAIDLPLEDL